MTLSVPLQRAPQRVPESRHALLQQEESAATGECIACIYIVRVNSPDPFPPFGWSLGMRP